MKLVQALVLSCAVVLMTALPARAEDLILTEAQIGAIQRACDITQQNLERLRKADRVLRVNLGQRYSNIDQHLMTPFITRAGFSGLDTVDLNTTKVQFRKEINVFAASAMTYQNSLHDAQAIDCRQQPIEFYTAIETARTNRLAVYEQTRKLNQLIDRFRSEVDELKSSLPGGAQ